LDRAEVTLHPEEIASLISAHYGLKVHSLVKVRAIYRADTEAGSFGFKNAAELPDLPVIAERLRRIRRNGFPHIPDFLPTAGGEYLIRHKGEAYFMEQWIESEEIPKQSFPYLHKIGSALADFHRAAGGIEFPRSSRRYEWGKRGSYLLRAYHLIEAWRRKPPLASRERDILDFLHYRCALAYEYVRHVRTDLIRWHRPEAAVLCHGGLHHKNMMIDRRQNIWFIDFETCAFAERVFDLAQLLQYHAAPYDWNRLVVDRFLQAYVSRLQRPIARGEWNVFFSYIAFPRRFYNRMVRYFGNPERPPEFFLKLKETLDQDTAKENFLRLYPPHASHIAIGPSFPFIG
jgi:CotS family spore coat protein